MSSAQKTAPPVCGWCRVPLPGDGSGRMYCGPTHRRKAQARRMGKPVRMSLRQHAELVQDLRGAAHGLDPRCEEKTPYPTPAAAEKIIRYRGGVGTVYECGGHWHITRRPLNAPDNWRTAFESVGL